MFIFATDIPQKVCVLGATKTNQYIYIFFNSNAYSLHGVFIFRLVSFGYKIFYVNLFLKEFCLHLLF